MPEFTLPNVRGLVAGEALEALGEDGKFRRPEPWSPSERVLVTPASAMEVARVFLRDGIIGAAASPCPDGFGCASAKEEIEASWCEPIAWDRVTVGSSYWFFGEPPTESPADSLLQPTLNHWGPKYFAPVLAGSRWIATIIVAAHATNVIINDQDRIRRLGPSGSEFNWAAVTCAMGAGTPPAPEQAVHFAATQTGRKVIAVPVLVTPGVYVGAGGSRWRIVLDAPARMRRADGTILDTDVVYVSVWPNPGEPVMGPGMRLSIPADEQPSFEVRNFGALEGEIHFPRRADIPLRFVGVIVVP